MGTDKEMLVTAFSCFREKMLRYFIHRFEGIICEMHYRKLKANDFQTETWEEVKFALSVQLWVLSCPKDGEVQVHLET
jgi:hypothetical protein